MIRAYLEPKHDKSIGTDMGRKESLERRMINLVWLVDRPNLGRVVAHKAFRRTQEKKSFVCLREREGIAMPFNSL